MPKAVALAGKRSPVSEAKERRRPAGQHVELLTSEGISIRVSVGQALSEVATRWAHAARYRGLWSNDQDAVETMAAQALEDWRRIVEGNADPRPLAKAQVIDVRIPFSDGEARAACLVPWEFFITCIAADVPGAGPTIFRSFQGRRPPSVPSPTLSALLVETAPGPLRQEYDFEDEWRIVSSGLRMSRGEILKDPSLDRFEERLRLRPHVVHIAGVDNHEAYSLMKERGLLSGPPRDGLPVPGSSGRILFGSADEWAARLRSSGATPALVTCNVYNSAASVAPLMVNAGAEAAIGFQDTIDDEAAEGFLALFYGAWRASHYRDVRSAFESAWEGSRRLYKDLRGTGIVLWTARSLLEPDQGAQPEVPVEEAYPAEPLPNAPPALVMVKHLPELNYAQLHNGENLFKTFQLCRERDAAPEQVEISVALNTGDNACRYTRLVLLDKPVVPLADDIRLPLTSPIFRGINETVCTALHVDVGLPGQPPFWRETLPVRLTPADQWIISRGDGTWLPSFVFPRDPAISRIVSAAHRYLVALRDDAAATLNGYESLDKDPKPGDKDPFGPVDKQVQALWWALNDLAIVYVNPPPTYSDLAQRLRTPSQVVEGGRGTCIDLALMFAACLELIGIFPVIFTFADHACVGYWRSDKSHKKFRTLPRPTETEPCAGSNGSTAAQSKGGQPARYVLLPDASDHIVDAIGKKKHLVPLETNDLTKRAGITDARENAVARFSGRDASGAVTGLRQMIDLELARRHGITPLPTV